MENRRMFPRFGVSCAIVLLKDGVPMGEGVLCDLSAGGCAVNTATPLSRGDYLGAQVYLGEYRDPTAVVQVKLAVTRWTKPPKCGLEFIMMSSMDQQRLRQFVERLQGSHLLKTEQLHG